MKNEEKLSVVERFQQHAGVKDVLLADIAYTQGVSGNLLMTEKGNDNSWTDINIMCVPLNFFAFMNIPLSFFIPLSIEVATSNTVIITYAFFS